MIVDAETLLSTYFGGNGDLIFLGMNQDIHAGDRILAWQNGHWAESLCIHEADWPRPYHPFAIRLPDQFQSSLQKITCPVCKITYTHQHIFTPGASKPEVQMAGSSGAKILG